MAHAGDSKGSVPQDRGTECDGTCTEATAPALATGENVDQGTRRPSDKAWRRPPCKSRFREVQAGQGEFLVRRRPAAPLDQDIVERPLPVRHEQHQVSRY